MVCNFQLEYHSCSSRRRRRRSSSSISSKMHCCSLVVITNLRFTCALQRVLETSDLYLLNFSINMLYLTTGNEDVRSDGAEDFNRGSTISPLWITFNPSGQGFNCMLFCDVYEFCVLPTQHLCITYDSWDKWRLSPWTALNGWPYNRHTDC
jgi:hypothetical protein